MPPRITNCITGIALFLLSTGIARGQAGLCPPNLDLEMGDFTNWVCRTGGLANDGTINWATITTPVPGRHTMIAAPGGTDPYGGFPLTSPNGGAFCVQLGNENSPPGRQATEMSYTYTVPPTVAAYSMMIWYAVVLQDPPAGVPHSPVQRPRFRARITDVTTGSVLPCVDFDFIVSATLPGFRASSVDPSVMYKDWTPVSIDLSGVAGRTIKIEFLSLDCTLGGHFGYAYLDVNSNCNGAITGTTICQGDNSITLTAPYGFQGYEWYSDPTFSTLLATSQNLPLNPAPAVGTIMPVIVTPYPGFGCKDTLYATINISPKPVSVAGPDIRVCKFNQTTLGGPPTPGYNYSWTPSVQVVNPIASSTAAWAVPPGPSEFILKTTDILTGCFSYDTAYISNIAVDTAIRLAGNADFCVGQPGATLTISSSSTSIQWYDGSTPVPGANAAVFQPTVSGSYWAQFVQNTCTDSTAAITIGVHPLPIVSFIPDTDTSCVTKNAFAFTNNTTAPDNAALTYNWIFSDGTTQQVISPVKTFTSTGVKNIKLIATSEFGCADSSAAIVHVLPNGSPDFKWDSICLSRPAQFTNLSSENGSPLTKYSWDFQNGGTGSLVKDPPPVRYTAPGTADVTLQLISLGCENDPKTVTKNVQVNRDHLPVRYRTITVPQGASHYIHVRDSIGTNYNWKPALQLSKYDAQYTEFFATGNDVQYLVDITDKHTCITTDTILMQILKKPGYYLPTGFTPNGDGLNDVVRPYLVGMKALKSFSVFNRWGQLVYYTSKEGEGWNGKLNGEDLDPGVFVWMLEFLNNDNKLITEKGTITLIR
jgi:gliding motility-associated-like protein